MTTDWKSYIDALDFCIYSLPGTRVEVPTDEQEQEEPNEEEQERRRKEEEDILNRLNHKLIEIHSKLKALDEEANDPGPTGDDSSPDSRPTAVLSKHFAHDLAIRCVTMLNSKWRPAASKCHALSAQLLAELGRSELGRKVCLRTDLNVAEAAESALKMQREIGRGGVETMVQICRVLGNMCFHCEQGRFCILPTSCLEQLRHLSDDVERMRNDDPAQRLAVILPGFLLNYCNGSAEPIEQTSSANMHK